MLNISFHHLINKNQSIIIIEKKIKQINKNKTMTNKNLIKIINNLKLGNIKVYKTPTLPNQVINFNKNIFVRIFRVIGGICLLLTLTKNLFNYS